VSNPIPTWNTRLSRIQTKDFNLGVWICICWTVFIASFVFVVYWHVTGVINNSELGGLLQGTSGIAAAVISVLYLLRGIYGTEKQLVLASQQSHVQSEEQKLDRALEGRAALVPRPDGGYGGVEAVAAHAGHLLRQCRSYLGALDSVESVRDTARREVPQNVVMDRYVTHLKLVLSMAAAADEGSDASRLVDHVWHGLTIEERALAMVLIACGEDIPRPSADALSGWELAIEPYLPWNTRDATVRKLLA
jgi:hypothetical protein